MLMPFRFLGDRFFSLIVMFTVLMICSLVCLRWFPPRCPLLAASKLQDKSFSQTSLEIGRGAEP